MPDSLVERLRENWKAWGSPTDRYNCMNESCMAMDCKEAADALERQSAELAALREWDVREFWKAVQTDLALGEGMSHEDGWTLLPTGTANKLKRERDDLREQVARYQWQPIETAPKDGSYILVTMGRGAWVAHWAPVAASGYRFERPWRSVMLNHDHIAVPVRYLPPTHWMPLPPPPIAQQQGTPEG